MSRRREAGFPPSPSVFDETKQDGSSKSEDLEGTKGGNRRYLGEEGGRASPSSCSARHPLNVERVIQQVYFSKWTNAGNSNATIASSWSVQLICCNYCYSSSSEQLDAFMAALKTLSTSTTSWHSASSSYGQKPQLHWRGALPLPRYCIPHRKLVDQPS